jgi:ABC-type hemin transport system ATPase subunit
VILDAQGRIAADGPPAEVLRAPTLETVYRCRVGIHADPDSGTLRVFPRRTRSYAQVQAR